MPTFIPMIRSGGIFNPSLREQLTQMFDKRAETDYPLKHPLSPSEIYYPTLPKKKKIVLIKFRLLPSMKRFRWDKEWWRKTSFKGGTKDGHEFEIPAEDLVGVYLKDLDKGDLHLIEKKK